MTEDKKMEIPKEHKGRFFYHFTHLDNIESIVRNGFLSTNIKIQRGITHHNVANANIQHRRSTMPVNVGPGGVVHDYVPFYFASTNIMLLGLLNRKIVDQPYVVFIVVSIEKVLEHNVIFTDASANTDVPPNFYDSPVDLKKLDWSLIDSKKWKTESEEDLHKRMAEVLVHEEVPLDWIDRYIVFNDIAKNRIEGIYRKYGLDKPVVQFQPFNNRFFYYTKFFMKQREKETLVTGPEFLKQYYQNVIIDIIEERKIKI